MYEESAKFGVRFKALEWLGMHSEEKFKRRLERHVGDDEKVYWIAKLEKI